jgi:uncharacterized protein YwgA
MRLNFEFDWSEIKRNETPPNELRVSDLILFLLNAGQVSGKTMLQKQIFLTWKEVLKESNAVDPQFYPHYFGPYSDLVFANFEVLRSNGIIKVLPRGEGHMTSIISKNGTEIIEKRIEQIELSGEILKLLKNRKADWDEWTTKGIIRYVYRNYPEYAVYSKLKGLLWE